MVNLVSHQALSLHTPTHHYGTLTVYLYLYHGHIQFRFLYRLFLCGIPFPQPSIQLLSYCCIYVLTLCVFFRVLFSSLFFLVYFFVVFVFCFCFRKPSNSACSATWQPICMTFCRHKKIWIKEINLVSTERDGNPGCSFLG